MLFRRLNQSRKRTRCPLDFSQRETITTYYEKWTIRDGRGGISWKITRAYSQLVRHGENEIDT